jgi:cholesterol oxidase
MSTNFWDPGRGLYGLFDIWSFRRFESVVSSGLGGGSLIYANVLMRKPPAWFSRQEAWPVKYDDLTKPYDRAEKMLGVTRYPYVDSTHKTTMFRRAALGAGMTWSAAPLAVSFSPPGQPLSLPVGTPEDNLHNVPRATCRMSGECDIGCNAGAKNTTDLTYLTVAELKGADIRTLHEAKRIVPLGDRPGFAVHGVEHRPSDPPWRRETANRPSRPICVTTRTVVLAAGAYGSTFLLLRNRLNLPRLSDRLGTRFSGNGDYLGFVRGGGVQTFNASRAPVITSYVQGDDDLDHGMPERARRGHLLEDGGYPIVADWLGEALSPATVPRLARVVWQLAKARLTGTARTQISSSLTDAIGGAALSRGTLPVLGMGRDLPEGEMFLRDGALDIRWSDKSSAAVFACIRTTLEAIASELGGRFYEGPSSLLSRMITVHPLGGCPMATGPDHGVVDDHGEVFRYPGLFVCDGAVMPGPVGVNPALTIAALAEHFAGRVLERTN